MGKGRDKERLQKFWFESLNGRDTGVYQRIILKWVLDKSGGKIWTGFIRLKVNTSFYVHEYSGSLKGGELLKHYTFQILLLFIKLPKSLIPQ